MLKRHDSAPTLVAPRQKGREIGVALPAQGLPVVERGLADAAVVQREGGRLHDVQPEIETGREAHHRTQVVRALGRQSSKAETVLILVT